jgi:predicted kinase
MDQLVSNLTSWVTTFEATAPLAVIMIGNSGSGKSTLAQALAPALALTIVSTDAYRAELSATGDERDQSVNAAAWAATYQQAKKLLSQRAGVLIDATNAKSRDRQALIGYLRQFTTTVLGIWMDTPREICEQRNAARDLPRDWDALVSMDTYLKGGVVVKNGRSTHSTTPSFIRDNLTGLWRVTPAEW